jgi:hypothetical protein
LGAIRIYFSEPSMSEPGNRNGRIIIAIFIVLAVVTIGATIISNLRMWSWYDQVEAEQGIGSAAPAEPAAPAQ